MLETMDDFFQAYDVIVVAELLKNGDLADSSAWNSIIAVVNLDLLDCDSSTGGSLQGFVNDTIGSLTQFRLIFILA